MHSKVRDIDVYSVTLTLLGPGEVHVHGDIDLLGPGEVHVRDVVEGGGGREGAGSGVNPKNNSNIIVRKIWSTSRDWKISSI